MKDLFVELIQNANSVLSSQIKTFQRPFVHAKICELPIRVLYDTGADICCLNEKHFREIPIDKRPVKVDDPKLRQFRSAGGQQLQVKGKYLLPISVGEKSVLHPFYVIKDLSESAILGIDFIQQHSFSYCPEKHSFSWKRSGNWQKGVMKLSSYEIVPPLTSKIVRVQLLAENGCRPALDTKCMVNVCVPNKPVITGGPALVTADGQGHAAVLIQNCSPTEICLERGSFVGLIENINDSEMRELNPKYINAVAEQAHKLKPKVTISDEKKQFILNNCVLNVPEEFKSRYVQVLIDNHEAISESKHDLGRTDTLMHEITLKTNEPIYVKQFRIPEAHRIEVEKHVAEWLKLGVIQPTRSKFNSPIFVVAKKDGGLRMVQDFRALNAQTHVDKYSMKDVNECIGDIGRSGSTIFSTLDLTSGFWQMVLHPKSREFTAFTVAGQGQYQWVTSPMGLLGCPSSFQRLMETVVAGMPNVLVYIDDLLVHSCTHEDHLAQLNQLLQRLAAHGIKINLKKCVFGSKNVSYLGFRLTEEGIKPGTDKLKAVAAAKPPSNVHEIRQFLGLCNFFRTHVRNFSMIATPLTALTKKDAKWSSGELPPDAYKAFRELQTCLCSEPVVDYPRRDRPYALITDAALGDDNKPGGLGAILTQFLPNGEQRVIAYASRSLQKHEKNYTPFLLEMQAAIWGMDHFSVYLRGRHFTLFTDHKPLEKLGKVHTRTLNRLQEAMNEFDFEIVYKKGSEMPADFLSRNVVDAISWDSGELQAEQQTDPLIRSLKDYLLNRQLPKDPQCERVIRLYANDCFVENDLVWRRVKRKFEPSRVVLFLPQTLVPQVLQEAHGQLLSGHDGIFKTKERIFQCYYWPGMDSDIQQHIQSCHKCQLRRVDHRPPPALLTPLPQPTEPNQRIHADLFGPLVIPSRDKHYILCMTDAFTKYVELVALPNKEAPTVCEAIFEKWICRYSVPVEIVTDQGREFCNKLSDELYKLLKMTHQTTTSRHPQCNSQAEVANKTIAKYLSSFVDGTTLDWEQFLAPLMFSYNTSFHRSIKTTPHFLTFGIEPRISSFPTPDLRIKFYGESSSADLYQRLLKARDLARLCNESATEEYKQFHDRKAEISKYVVGQLVLLDEHSFLHKNTKLAPKWSGPHRVIRIKNDNNYELLLQNGKHLLVHANRLKPYFVPTRSDNEWLEQTPAEKKSSEETPAESKSAAQNEEPFYFDESPRQQPLPPPPPPPPSRQPAAAPAQMPMTQSDQPLGDSDAPVKRRRGRPPKILHPPPPPSDRVLRSAQPAPAPPPAQPARPALIMPQIFKSALEDFAEGGGVQGQVEVQNDNKSEVTLLRENDASENEWTLVIRRHKRPVKHWSRRQQTTFKQSGDIYDFGPYANYQTHEGFVPVNTPVLVEEDVQENIDDEIIVNSEESEDEEEAEEEEWPPPPAPLPPPPPRPPTPPRAPSPPLPVNRPKVRPAERPRSMSFDITFTPPRVVKPPPQLSQRAAPTAAPTAPSAAPRGASALPEELRAKPKLPRTPPPSHLAARSTADAADDLLFGRPRTRSRGAAPDVPLSKKIPERKPYTKK